MEAQIDDLLDATRLRAGQPLALRRRPTDLVALARQAVELQQQATDRHRLTLAAAVPSLVGAWDPGRLERVLGNLLGNALKYSPARRGGHRRGGGGGGAAVLVVRDAGVGIPAAELPHVFERFRRAGNVADRIAGTGLGLAGARDIVEQHGGSIAVESVEGRGSAFTVRLPLAPGRPGRAGGGCPARPGESRRWAAIPAAAHPGGRCPRRPTGPLERRRRTPTRRLSDGAARAPPSGARRERGRGPAPRPLRRRGAGTGARGRRAAAGWCRRLGPPPGRGAGVPVLEEAAGDVAPAQPEGQRRGQGEHADDGHEQGVDDRRPDLQLVEGDEDGEGEHGRPGQRRPAGPGRRRGPCRWPRAPGWRRRCARSAPTSSTTRATTTLGR